MRHLKLTLGVLCSAVVVNLAVACAATAIDFDAQAGASGSGGALADAGAPGSGGSILDAAIDAMLPRDAAAEPAVVVTSNCDVFVGPPGGQGSWYAVADFPGRSLAELAPVAAAGETTGAAGPPPALPPGFTHVRGLVVLRDGSAAMHCGSGNEDPSHAIIFYDPVIFVLPPTP